MLKYLKLENVGPAAKMELDLAPRLNIITGDNGLGKSFLLDVAWFVNTGSWPRDVNSGITSGYMALPRNRQEEAIIQSQSKWLEERSPIQEQESKFERFSQSWRSVDQKSLKPRALTIYAMADGAVAIYDHARSGNPNTDFLAERAKYYLPPAFVFSQQEILNGFFIKQKDKADIYLCNGLITDWANWQNKKVGPMEILQKVLLALSPDESHPMRPGELTRISIEDVRDMPTILMSYGDRVDEQVPVVHCSSAIRRIISFAYMLVWMWEEHKVRADLIGNLPPDELLILIDEVECHLHPSWQRKIVPALLEAVSELSKDLQVQLIATTHSPLVMASLEPHFDAEKDAWFDLDLVRDNWSKPEVVLTKRPFEKLGSANHWLVSDAFDLPTPDNIPLEAALQEASAALRADAFDQKAALKIDQKLTKLLNPSDPAWTRWKMLGKQKGWWE